jgi:hypothetical protein
MKYLFVALLLSSTTALAQSRKTPVAIKCEPRNNDTVGSQLCTAIRDAVARSPRYSEVDENPAGWEIAILTGTTQENVNTAASMVVVFRTIYADHELKLCSASTVRRCADGFLATLDDDVSTFRKAQAGDHPSR